MCWFLKHCQGEIDTALKWFQQRKPFSPENTILAVKLSGQTVSQSDKQDRDIDEQSEEMNALDMTAAKPEYSCLFHFIFVN